MSRLSSFTYKFGVFTIIFGVVFTFLAFLYFIPLVLGTGLGLLLMNSAKRTDHMEQILEELEKNK